MITLDPQLASRMCASVLAVDSGRGLEAVPSASCAAGSNRFEDDSSPAAHDAPVPTSNPRPSPNDMLPR